MTVAFVLVSSVCGAGYLIVGEEEEFIILCVYHMNVGRLVHVTRGLGRWWMLQDLLPDIVKRLQYLIMTFQ